MSQWPNEPDKRGGWPWMDFTRPQRVLENLNGVPECINVSVAQHPQIRFGDSVLYGETTNCGRAYHDGANDPDPDAYKYCGNFIEQFERAIQLGAGTVLLISWNEWTNSEQLSLEISKDLEPSETLGTFYYDLMKAEIARFKQA